jgi:hypothetical protein
VFEPAAVPADDPVWLEPEEAPVVPVAPPVVFPVPSPLAVDPLLVLVVLPAAPLCWVVVAPEPFPGPLPQLSNPAKQNATAKIVIPFRMNILSSDC